MKTTTMDVTNAQESDIFSLDASEVFTGTTVLSDEDELGTVVSATVAEKHRAQLKCAKVTVRILAISAACRHELWRKVEDVQRRAGDDVGILQYIGMWTCGRSTETWVAYQRFNQVSLKSLFESVESGDRESMLAYIAQQVLQTLDRLHDIGVQHGYIRTSTIHIGDDGTIRLSDPAIYDVLREELEQRRTFPGKKIWPMQPRGDESDDSDMWDVAITLLCVQEGTVGVSRMWHSGRKRRPKLSPNSGCSHQMQNFVNAIFAQCGRGVQLSSVLREQFVSGVSSTACRAAVSQFWKRGDDGLSDARINDTRLPDGRMGDGRLGDGLPDGHDGNELIARLFRRNEVVVRAPLVNVDELGTDMFDYEAWCGDDGRMGTGQQSLVRVMKVCKGRAMTTDVEDVKAHWRTTGTLETFLGTTTLI